MRCMIAESGIMIGFYIITRMVSLIRERVRTSGVVGLVVGVCSDNDFGRDRCDNRPVATRNRGGSWDNVDAWLLNSLAFDM